MTMNILDKINIKEVQKDYWGEVLGEEWLNQLLEQKGDYTSFLEEEIDLEKEKIHKFLEQDIIETEQLKEEWIFYPFFNRIRCFILYRIEIILQQNSFISIAPNVSQTLAKEYVEGIQWIALRCLIQEMELLKQAKKLNGETAEKEYDYFLNEYLSRPEFLEELISKYPVMIGLLFRKADAYISYLEQVLIHLKQDKELLEKELCNGRKINAVDKIQTGLSDEHKLGETVLRIVFDNEYVVYYKPRALRSEWEYQKIYRWVCEACGLKYYHREILDCGVYGWEREVETKSCKEREEIRRYYERMGIHLCLTYLFGISDIHYENIIACGEYPVLIDLEVFPGRRKYAVEAESTLEELMHDSVLSTGILPGQQWGGGNVNTSAMGNKEKQRSPFKMPVIKGSKTSDMHISYDYVEVDSSRSMPRIKGQRMEASEFMEAVEEGFENAYKYIADHKEQLIKRLGTAEEWKSRYLIRHTQQYKMYQMTASFPQFMKDVQERRLMLLRMKKGLNCDKRYEKELLMYEAEATMYEVFPVYYSVGRSLQMGNGILIENYFLESAEEQIICRLKGMNAKDRYRQQKIIALSMTADNLRETKQVPEKKERYITAEQIADRVVLDMEMIQGKSQWITLKYGQKESWQFQTMDRYLYDGIAGIAVFLTAFGKVYGMNRYEQIRKNVMQNMFEYTDQAVEDNDRLDSNRTGIMNGESSLVYAYLLLNQMCSDEKLLNYAEKHAQVVKKLIEEDHQFDILDGNAGAIIVMVHLYEITGKSTYLKIAEQAADKLLSHVRFMKEGIGWVIPGQEHPLAGFAHGNSGIMLAFARLWKISRKPYYHEVIHQAKKYEDSLYDKVLGNWKDLRTGKVRKEDENSDIIAWCHGAGGILIAGTAVDSILGIEVTKDERLQQAEKRVISQEKREYCLCHGELGNATAVEYYRKSIGKEYSDLQKLLEWESMLPQEKYQAGFMTGLSGIGYALLNREYSGLSNILALELLV